MEQFKKLFRRQSEKEMEVAWVNVPTEIHCMVLSFLNPQELCPVYLVNSRFKELADSDAVWKIICSRHFPHHTQNIDTKHKESVGIDPDAEEKHYLVRQLPSYPDDISWKERYKRLARNLFVMHHKYNSINSFALQDALLKWETSGAQIIDMRASCNAFLEENLNDHLEDVTKILKRHRVMFIFTDGGMKENYRNPLGDILCDFVEEGNAVIVGTFCTVATAEMPGGKWAARNYNPILPDTQDSNIHFLGEKILPFHPILKDVMNISASWKATGEPNPEANVIAVYESGYVLAAEIQVNADNKKGLVIALNVYLPSSDSPLNGWSNEPGNDVAKMFFNAFKYAMSYVCHQNEY